MFGEKSHILRASPCFSEHLTRRTERKLNTGWTECQAGRNWLGGVFTNRDGWTGGAFPKKRGPVFSDADEDMSMVEWLRASKEESEINTMGRVHWNTQALCNCAGLYKPGYHSTRSRLHTFFNPMKHQAEREATTPEPHPPHLYAESTPSIQTTPPPSAHP
jgi:hypothetical protein